jgi:hypothetical protein
MFGNKKLKKRIDYLSDQIDYLTDNITDLNKGMLKLNWQLENPPKYKIGQKTKFGTLSKVEVVWDSVKMNHELGCGYIRKYKYHFTSKDGIITVK